MLGSQSHRCSPPRYTVGDVGCWSIAKQPYDRAHIHIRTARIHAILGRVPLARVPRVQSVQSVSCTQSSCTQSSCTHLICFVIRFAIITFFLPSLQCLVILFYVFSVQTKKTAVVQSFSNRWVTHTLVLPIYLTVLFIHLRFRNACVFVWCLSLSSRKSLAASRSLRSGLDHVFLARRLRRVFSAASPRIVPFCTNAGLEKSSLSFPWSIAFPST